MSLKFSIIIPVYNAEQYLAKSLNSYCNQTYKNYEIICVDDGSTDDSINILKSFAKKNNRIKIIKQKNAGPATARQTGLNNATGDYVWFVDADDSCEIDSLNKIKHYLKNYHYDILYFGVKLIQDKYEKHPSEAYYGLKNIPNLRFKEDLDLEHNAYLLFSLPRELWNKVYRREFLVENDIKFCHLISLYDDILFTTMCLFKSSSIKLSNDILYHYHMNHLGSIMGTANKRIDGIFYYFEIIHKFLEEETFSLYIKRNWLCKEICSMNYWLTRSSINQKYYFKRLKKLYKNIQNEIYNLTPNDSYQMKNQKRGLEIITSSKLLCYLLM